MEQKLISGKKKRTWRKLFFENSSKRYVSRPILNKNILYDRKTGKVISESSEIDEKDIFYSPTFDVIAPLKAYLDPSFRCNLSCRHCLTNSSPNVDTSDELPPDRILELVEEVAFSGAVEIGIGGGEPLLYSNIYNVLALGKKIGLNTVMTTNGVLITPEIANRLQEFNLYEIRVSFEGYQPIHDDIRGPGRYKQALNAVAILAARNLRVKARLTLTSKGDQELHNLFRDLSSCGVRDIKVTAVKEVGRAAQNKDLLGYVANFETGKKLIEMGNKYDMSVELSADDFPLSIKDTKNKKPRSGKCNNCGAGLETVYISPTGKVYPCASVSYYPFGDIKNRAFMDILKNETTATYRKLALACSDTKQERHLCKHPFLRTFQKEKNLQTKIEKDGK